MFIYCDKNWKKEKSYTSSKAVQVRDADDSEAEAREIGRFGR